MYIKKETGKVVHRGYRSGNWAASTDCSIVVPAGNTWSYVNPEVIEGIRKGSVKHLRLCKKCFKE
jgi:hypothetical protein